MGAPEVCRAHDDEAAAGQAAGGEAGRQRALELAWARQRCWLKRRRTPDGEGSSLRPAKRYRTSAKAWLLNLDNQLCRSLPLRGLADFAYPMPRLAEVPWRDQLHLQVALDQGSDGLAAASFLRHLGVNATFIMDWSHGVQNELYESLRECALWSFWLLLLVAMNVEHGPFNDDGRWNQLRDCWQGAVENHDPQSFPLFLPGVPPGGHAGAGGSRRSSGHPARRTLSRPCGPLWRRGGDRKDIRPTYIVFSPRSRRPPSSCHGGI